MAETASLTDGQCAGLIGEGEQNTDEISIRAGLNTVTDWIESIAKQ